MRNFFASSHTCAEMTELREAFRQQDVIQRGQAPVGTTCFTKDGQPRTIVGRMARGGRYRLTEFGNSPAPPLRYQDCFLVQKLPQYGRYKPF